MRTMVDKACERYEDLFVLYPDDASDAEKARIDDANRERVKFYRAVRYLLTNHFTFPAAIPPPPNVPPVGTEANDLLHGLDDGEKAYFVSVAGILLANSLSDPLAGKKEETLGPGDIRDKDDTKYPIRIAQAFNDATAS